MVEALPKDSLIYCETNELNNKTNKQKRIEVAVVDIMKLSSFKL